MSSTQRDSPSDTSAIYRGTVRHRRRRPRPHTFRMSTYHVLVDVDELGELDRCVRGFGYNRRALTTFYDRDHFGLLDLPVRDKISGWLERQGRSLPAGRLTVLTNLRVAGYVFNPVSWWFCYDLNDNLVMVLAEVNNTFGDHHVYILDDLATDGAVVRAAATKVFHVSPFLPITPLEYRFTVQPPGDHVMVHMDVDDRDGKLFDATQRGVRQPFTTAVLWRMMARHPLAPLMTIGAIHWHAIRLALKRVPFHRRPVPVDDGFDRPPGRRRPGSPQRRGPSSRVDHDRARSRP